MSTTLPFDEVKIEDKTFSADDFLSLPLFKRVRFVLGGTLQFFKQGAPVDQTTALKALRERAA
jgi:hypothetical protein